MKWIETAVEKLDQRVAFAAGGALEPVVGADDLATRHENDFDEVFEAAADYFGVRAIGVAADEGAGFTREGLVVGEGEFVAVGVAGRHVEQAIWAKGHAVEGAVVGVAEGGEDFGGFVGGPVVVGVFEDE